jgi:hypothetical protein
VRVSIKSKKAAAAIVLAALLISVAPTALASTPRRVVVVLAPYLTWADIASMPAARALASTSIVADTNVRAGGAQGASTPERGALVLSAGAPINAADGALSAYNASESVGAATARDLYLQYFGKPAGASGILFVGQPRQLLANTDPSSPGVIGALGSAARAAGARTYAIGNADLGMLADPPHASRPAAEAVSDVAGTADGGDVSPRMLVADPGSPYGARADVEAILTEYRSALASPGGALVVIDPGDLFRATSIGSSVTSEAAAGDRARAVKSTDAVIAGVVAGAGPDDTVIVLTQAVPSPPDISPGYGPLIVRDGTGATIGTSGSTHRDGLVTAMDVSATIIDLLGGAVPASMSGSRIHAGPTLAGAMVDERVAFLDRLNATSVAVETVRMTVVNYFIALSVIVLLGATIILYRNHAGLSPRLAFGTRVALLLPIAMLLGAVLQFVVWRWPGSAAEVVWELVAMTALSLGLALLSLRLRRVTLPLIVLTTVTTIALLCDQWLGAPLSLAGIFGYSPLLGARYYGMGNEMAGLVLGSAVVAFALVLDTWRDARWAKPMRVWGWPLLGIVLLATAAAPMWGANVGPAAWMTVGFLVGWLLLNGKKVWTLRNFVMVVVLVLVALAGLSALDLARGADAQTHLGRAITGAESGGISTLWTIVVRKAETNMRVLGRTNWTWMLVAVLVLLGYMRWRPRGEFGAMLKQFPAFSVAVAAALFAGVVGYFTEDSGIIIPALMFIPVGVTALYLMLLPATRTDGDGA